MLVLSKIRFFVLSLFLLGIAAMAAAQPSRPALPDQIRRDLQALLSAQPQDVFVRLAGDEGRSLSPQERHRLAQQALARLIGRVEVSNNRWATLTEVRTAHQHASSFGADIREALTTLAAVAERRALADAVFEVRHLSERGQGDQAVRRGQQWLKRLHELRSTKLDDASMQVRSEVHKALTGIVHRDQERQALDALREGLRKGEVDRVAIADLPPSLTRSVQALRSLQTVQELAGETRLKDRDITALKQALTSFLAGVRPLPEADAALGSRILQELAVRHFLQGHSREYRELMPADGSPEQAARLLRDLKALTLGQGEVVTNPARVVLAKKGDRASEPPDGVRMLLSDNARKGWRPPQAAGEKAEPSPLERAAEIGRTLAGKIQTEAVKERIKQEERITEAHRLLDRAQRRLQANERDDDKSLGNLKKQYDREATGQVLPK